MSTITLEDVIVERATREKARRMLIRRQAEDVVYWAEEHFYISETQQPIVLLPHQKAILNYVFRRDAEGRFPYHTVVYSTPKKSGKTTIGGLVARWAAETWDRFGEVLCVGNDAEQAKERGFAALKQSIELHPDYSYKKKSLLDYWELLEAEATCITTGTHVKAIATDYKGEAGANPILTLWTELWGFIDKASLRFWAEMAPSPTRLNSMKWIETYAGYEGESGLLEGLYVKGVKEGRQLTAGELQAEGAFTEAPNSDDLIPCWVNDSAHLFVYWDSGDIARRMPWQQGETGREYYASEEAIQTPSQFIRLHRNEWASAESEFLPIEWWDYCKDESLPLPQDKTPIVIAADAAVSGDCFGLVGISRHPQIKDHVVVRFARLWKPTQGGSIDFSQPEGALKEFCSNYNIVQIAYDPYQLHDMMTRLQRDGVAWTRAFSQGQERLQSDKLLYDLIAQRRIHHDGNHAIREHLQNANAKHSKDEDTKVRLIKKSENRHIDLAVCLSMACEECLRLSL